MEEAEAFRTKVRTAMDAKGITITQLAALVGTSRPSMSRILSGEEDVTIKRAARIAKSLGLTLASLVAENLVHSS